MQNSVNFQAWVNIFCNRAEPIVANVVKGHWYFGLWKSTLISLTIILFNVLRMDTNSYSVNLFSQNWQIRILFVFECKPINTKREMRVL